MTLVSGTVVFFIIWWVVLFMILPIGVSVDKSPCKGHADSAPNQARIGLKFLITTLITVVLFFITKYLIKLNLIGV